MVSSIEKMARDSSRMVRRSPVLTILSRVNKNLNKKQSKLTSTNLKNIISTIEILLKSKSMSKFMILPETMSTHSLGPELKMLLFQTEAKTLSQATVMLIQMLHP